MMEPKLPFRFLQYPERNFLGIRESADDVKARIQRASSDISWGNYQTCADLGCGQGAITLAMIDLLPAGFEIDSVDLNVDLHPEVLEAAFAGRITNHRILISSFLKNAANSDKKYDVIAAFALMVRELRLDLPEDIFNRVLTRDGIIIENVQGIGEEEFINSVFSPHLKNISRENSIRIWRRK